MQGFPYVPPSRPSRSINSSSAAAVQVKSRGGLNPPSAVSVAGGTGLSPRPRALDRSIATRTPTRAGPPLRAIPAQDRRRVSHQHFLSSSCAAWGFPGETANTASRHSPALPGSSAATRKHGPTRANVPGRAVTAARGAGQFVGDRESRVQQPHRVLEAASRDRFDAIGRQPVVPDPPHDRPRTGRRDLRARGRHDCLGRHSLCGGQRNRHFERAARSFVAEFHRQPEFRSGASRCAERITAEASKPGSHPERRYAGRRCHRAARRGSGSRG